MKKFIALLIRSSLILAAAAMAQQPEDQPQNQPSKKLKKNQAEQRQAAGTVNEAKPSRQHGRNGKAASQQNAGSNANAPAITGAPTSQAAGKHGGRKNREGKTNAETAETNVNPNSNTASSQSNPSTATGTAKGKGRLGRNARNDAATESSNAALNTNAASASGPAGTQTNVNANATARRVRGHGKGGKQLNQQVVQKVKTEHAHFKAQPRPEIAPAVTFNQHHRIEGAEHWHGPQYNVFRSYHPKWHDRSWYHSHYRRVELIGGGYYYWNNGYWFPAWGYDPSAAYYAYDGPIYVGRRAEPPDQVIADVQAILKEAGYYEGEVDGLLGPLTREALTAYQADNGLYTTAAIDEPTLESLGLS